MKQCNSSFCDKRSNKNIYSNLLNNCELQKKTNKDNCCLDFPPERVWSGPQGLRSNPWTGQQVLQQNGLTVPTHGHVGTIK